MALFGKRKVTDPSDELAAIRAEVARLASALRTLETEQVTMHDQVRKWMRRAVAAETRRVEETNQEPGPAAALSTRETPSPPRLNMWGARRRIAERRAAETNGGGD